MNKLGYVVAVIVMVSACYIVMLVVMPVLTDLAATANATMTADVADLDAYPGSQGFLLSIPWILWFVPGCLGIVIVFFILKS